MINTLAIAHKLTNSGFDEEQAEAITNVFADVAKKQHQDLATKDFVTSQIQTVRAEISAVRGDMNSMEGNLRAEMKAQETRLVRWMLVTFFGGMGILFTALSFFPG